MKVLVTAIGKRVQLIKHLKQNFFVAGTDSSELNAGRNFTDKFFKVPKYYDENYINELITICKNEKINLLVPLYEKEFLKLSNNREEFKRVGTKLMLSGEKIIHICNDKKRTYEFFIKNSIKTPKVFDNLEQIKEKDFPVIIKPLDGMGSDSVFTAKDKKELDFFKEYVKNPMIQEKLIGTEYTIDVLCDFSGEIISIVPRERIEVVSGEVVKSRSVKNKTIIKECEKLLEKLKKEKTNGVSIVGPLTIQCFEKENGSISFIEINPRFGGGVPLAFESKINYAEIFFKILNGEDVKRIYDFEEKTMIRFHDAIIL